MNLAGNEPVVVGALTTIMVWLAARYGIQLSAEQASAAAAVVLVVLTPLVRGRVTPTAKTPPAPAPPRSVG